jgi:hypothetical protein
MAVRALAVLAIGWAMGAGLQAQDRSDPARLDDFALPATGPSSQVEQVTKGPVSSPPEQTRDRTLARPARSEPIGTVPAQLSAPNPSSDVSQLSSRGQSRLAPAGPATNPTDKLPGAVQRIGGQDRCDPQASQAAYAQCLRILELRADEFNAPSAPVLSPEQRLLGVMQPSEEGLVGSGGLRARQATRSQPDADVQSDQELASIYLAAPPGAEPLPQPEETDASGRLVELLESLNIGPAAPPPGN